MKPIHHALVSARLFGGDPMNFLPIHQLFDSSKGAVADMRHRTALHSVDHGAAVMRLVFPDMIKTGGALDKNGGVDREEICIQHVLDDQGFRVCLDDWLKGATPPSFITLAPKAHGSREIWKKDPVAACVERWGGKSADYQAVVDYYSLPESFSDSPIAPAISRNAFGIMLSDTIFGPALRITGKTGKPTFVPTRDIGEQITLAWWGKIPNLADVLSGMVKEDWMTGARVGRSRERRKRLAGRQDLFEEDLEGVKS